MLIEIYIAEIIKKHLPWTFACVETVDSQLLGALPVKRSRGEGGLSDLATRISNNFYNDYVRYAFRRLKILC